MSQDLTNLASRIEGLSESRRRLLERMLHQAEVPGVQAPDATSGQVASIRPVLRDRSLPLSFAQQRLWLLDRLTPGNPAYNVAMAARLPGPLHPVALERAISAVVQRHEVLRTTFDEIDEQSVQIIAPEGRFSLRTVDLAALPGARREAEARRLAVEEQDLPFDLRRGPLLRGVLLRVEPDEHLLLVTLHHIVGDGWSMGIFRREVQQLYQAFVENRPSPLPALPIQYADFAVWQRERLQGSVLESGLSYWKGRLRDLPEPLELPSIRTRTPGRPVRAQEEKVQIPGEITRGLREICRREKATLFILLLAAFKALLYRYTGQADLSIGVPVAGRDRLETEGLIGCFLNTLVIRTDLSGDPGFRELIAQVRERVLEAQAHQSLPFEKLLEELQPERSLSHTPLFQVLFNMLNFLGPMNEPDPRQVQEAEGASLGAKFDLTLYAMERETGIELRLHYDSGLFDRTQMTVLGEHLRALLEGIAGDPGIRLSDLPLVRPRGREITADRPWTGFPPEEIDQSITRRFEQWVRRSPDALAVETEDHRWTYERLSEISARAAVSILETLGEGEARVGLLFEHGAPMIAGMLAVLQAGKTYVPLDPAYPVERLAHALADSGARAILADAPGLGLTRSLAPAGVRVLELDLEEVEGSGPASFPRVAPETPAYILYTSGSTGQPKGVVQSHRNVLHHIRAYTNALRISAEDRLSLFASYAFDAAVMDIYGALLNGAAVFPYDVKREGTAPLAAWIDRRSITIYHSTPTLLRAFLDELGTEELRTLRLAVLGGEKLLRRDLERLRGHCPPGCLVVNGLGPTESTVALQLFVGGDDAIDRDSVPVGYPVEETEVLLRNEAGEQAAVYGYGEIVLRSRYLALGYWSRPDLTASVFQPDPDGGDRRLYRTGDLGRWLADGSIEFIGRRDFQVKVRGHRVELGEIEGRLAECPGVKEAVVAAREDAGGRQRLVAYFRSDGETPTVMDLRRSLREWLPDYMIPSAFVAVEVWPLTPTGKVDRASLPDPGSAGRLEEETRLPEPATPVEELLGGLWSDLLGRRDVRPDSDFFALGGHSLLATQLISRIRRLFGVELPLRDVFESPTVAGLAGRIMGALQGEAAPSAPIVPVPRQGPLPLSSAQRRLWFLDRLTPGGSAYNMPAAVRLTGPLDPLAFSAALGEIVRRHEILRTTFQETDGEPVQTVASPPLAPLPRVDLRSLPPRIREAETRRLAGEEAGAPFDLERDPVLRARLLQLADQENALLVTVHHIAADGWSLGVISRELGILYGAFSADRPSPLPELPFQYADFACWQRSWLEGEGFQEQLAYWRERLRGAPDRLDLPMDHPRPAVPTMRRGAVPFSLPPTLAPCLAALAAAEGSTRFMILLAALQILLGRYTGGEDIPVGTPVAGRGRLELEGLVGMFVNTLVLRGDLSGNPELREFLRRTRETLLEAHAHQDLPFERLVEELRPERILDISPLFQVLFTMQNAPRPEIGVQGLAVSPLEASAGGAKLDLSFTVSESSGMVAGVIEYAAELFDPPTIARLARHLAALLASAVENPSRRLTELDILGEEERHQILAEWGDTAAGDPRDTLCVHELVLAQAARTSGAVAAISGEERLTYAELVHRSGQVAAQLAARGAGPGAFVPVLVPHGLDLVVAMLAVLRTGAAFVPLDAEWPAARLGMVLEELGGGVALAGGAGALPPVAAGWDFLSVGDLADGEEIPDLRCDPEAPIYAIYTSGSTGRPKGVLVPHRGIVNRFLWMDRFFGPAAARAVLQTTRPVYDSAVWQILWPLTQGGATILTAPGEGTDAGAVAEIVRRYRITMTDCVPAVFNLLVAGLLDGTMEAGSLSSLRALVVGGEEMGASAAREFRRWLPDATLVNLYGPTEASIGCICHTVGESRRERVPIGRPISNVQALILGSQGSLAPIEVPGELHLAGRCLGLGYLGDEEQTRRAFVPNPFPLIAGDRLYRTGDLARLLPNGSFEFLGRIDHQIKIRGVRIEPGEIESVLRQHPGVREAAVVVREDPGPRGLALAAYVVPRPGPRPATEDLRDFLLAKLPQSLVPSAFVTLEELPLTAGGKLDRRALPAPGREDRPAEEGPRTQYEEILAGIWAEVLRREDLIGPAHDFFALGGHSLLVTQVAARIRRTFGVELPIRALFEAPTLAGLARRIEESVRTARGSAVPPLRPAPRDGALPLSFAQQRLWFLERLAPGQGVYNLFTSVRLEGRLDREALDRSLGELVRRHQVLSTTFPVREDGPVQVVNPADPRPLRSVDLRALPEGERRDEAQRLIREQAGLPFDLARGPLFRPVLLTLGLEDQALLLAVHHTVCDGWSNRILTRELAILYGAFSRGEPSSLPELPLQYGDFAVWQREWLRGEVLEREIAYWRDRLAGAPRLLELSTDHPRPAVQSFRGSRSPVALPSALVGALGALGRREGATLFMTLLAALDTLLHRYTGQTKLLVGTPVANRGSVELEAMIGNFANTLVLAVETAGDLSFRDLLARVRESALAAYSHQDLPFEVLVEALNPERDLSHNPLFQVLFGLHNLPGGDAGAGGLTLHPMPVESGAARFDLAIDLMEAGGEIHGKMEYATALFDAATILRMAAHLRVLLEGAAGDPECRLSELPLLTGGERQQLLGEWNDAGRAGPSRHCLHRMFEAWAARQPGAVAAACGGETLLYGELDERAGRVARRLRELGVGPEIPVGLCVERSLDLAVGLLGILKAGGAYVPLDPAYPRKRLAWIVEDAGAPVLLTREELVPVLPEHSAAVVLLEEALSGPEWDGSVADPGVTADNLAYVIFTSGSTGRPKGVQITHGSVAHLIETTLRAFPYDESDAWTVFHSYAFDFSVWEIWGALATGGRLVIVPLRVAQSPPDFRELLERERVTVLNQTPSALRQLAYLEAGPPTSIRAIVCGGEAFPRELARTLADWEIPVWNFYGPTESTVWAAAGPLGDAAAGRGTVPLGRPLPDNRLIVLGPAWSPVPIGVPGELHIGGAGLARGYRGDPGLTAAKFIPDPFAVEPGGRLYRTGDLVRRLQDGGLEFLGRLDHQVKIRGFRVETGEIETILENHPALQEAVVMVGTEPSGENRLVAYVVSKSGDAVSADELRRHVNAFLPSYMCPSVLVFLESLPLSPNGKVDRRALPEPGRRGGEGPACPAPARDWIEHALVGIWQDLLQVERIGIRESFFDLGGHSLLAVLLMSRIRSRFQQDLPISVLFQRQTIEGLAALLRERTGPALRQALVEIQPAGDRTPLFFVHPVGGGVLCYAELARRMGTDQPFYAFEAMGEDDAIEDLARRYAREIRRAFPRGPRLLGGWSFGGTVALEIARQLRHEGEPVDMVALIDPPAPGSEAVEEGEEKLVLRFARDLAATAGVPAGLLAEGLGMSLEQAFEQARAAGLLPPDAQPIDFRRRYEIFRRNLRAFRAYSPRTHAERMAFILGESAPEPAGLWNLSAEGSLEVHRIAGDHYSLLRPPLVGEVAALLRRLADGSRPYNGIIPAGI